MSINVQQTFKEAVVIGLLTILAGYVASALVKPFTKVSLPDVCKTWNSKYAMQTTLFMTGFILHYMFEFAGLNDKYCRMKLKL
jgi:hypothetical protein